MTMASIRSLKFGTVPDSVLNDPKISFKAKGLYAYIQSKPE